MRGTGRGSSIALPAIPIAFPWSNAMNKPGLTALLCACFFVPSLHAQEAASAPDAAMQAMMEAWQKAAAVGPQHEQLAEHFAGTWDSKQTVWMDPSAPPAESTGKDVSEAIFGGRQIRTTFNGSWAGQAFEGFGLTGYDNVRGKYTTLWTDSMSTGMFTADGEYDPATKTYTFSGQMADPMKPDATTTVRNVIRIVDADHHVMEMYETRDGKEAKTMMIEYTRAK
ncbi:hypothetical protein GCM10027084_25170 [Pseudoxanthomonas sangjuensis]